MPRDTFPIKVAGAAAGALLLLLALGLYTIFGVDRIGARGTVVVWEEPGPITSNSPGAGRVVASPVPGAPPSPSASETLRLEPSAWVELDRSAQRPTPAADPERPPGRDASPAADRAAGAADEIVPADGEAASPPSLEAAPPFDSVEPRPARPRLLGTPIYRDPVMPPGPISPDTM